MPTLAPLLVFHLLLVQSAQTTAPAVDYSRTADVIYGRKYGTALTMDVFRPRANANGAGVVMVISGGWTSAHEAIDSWAKVWIDRFAARGYTVFAVVHGSQPRFTIPEAIEDLNRAVRYVRAHGQEYGVDPARLGISGGSAGGHLSLMQGLAPKPGNEKSVDPVERQPARVAAVAAFFPPTDFQNYGKPGESGLGVGKLSWLKAPFNFVEFDEKTKEVVRVTDSEKIREIGEAISPITHVTPDDPPVLLITGDDDKLVPHQQSEVLIEKLKAAGVECELIIKPGAGHGWPKPEPEIDAMCDWFDRHLKGAATKPAEGGD